jgi:hypothetical protein
MSNRRRTRAERAERRARSQARPADHGLPHDGDEPWMWAVLDADEAERRGDAAGALAVIERRPSGPEGKALWRPTRVQSLRQLLLLGPERPGWVVSRWIAAQAHVFLDEADRGPASRRERAIELAAELRGGFDALPGRDESDRWASVLDFDWTYRQLFLYDMGGLERFLRRGATPDLVAGADRIEEWASAPMGAYTYLGAFGSRLLWIDHATDAAVETIDIGTAARLLGGATVIGRVVPAGDELVFEGPPLEVPRAVARDVAARPAAWFEVLRGAADQVRDGTIATEVREWRTVASDVPLQPLMMLILHRSGALDDGTRSPAELLALGVLDLADSELEREAEEEDAVQLEHDSGGEIRRVPVDDEWDGWAHVHAGLLLPEVMEALPGVLDARGVAVLREVVDRVAEPARSWVAELLERNAKEVA